VAGEFQKGKGSIHLAGVDLVQVVAYGGPALLFNYSEATVAFENPYGLGDIGNGVW
jgi:hypothetical protein